MCADTTVSTDTGLPEVVCRGACLRLAVQTPGGRPLVRIFVMLDHPDHMRLARPYLEGGVPAFVDKFLSTDIGEAEEMVRLLVEGNEAVVRTARKVFPAVDAASDEPTADLLTQRMQIHEKNAWMLRSLLEE